MQNDSSGGIEMNYLYHMKPKKIVGEELMPLNKLKEMYPEVYNKEVEKYSGRLIVTKRKVFPLNCLWNDVLHFTAVHPSKINLALEIVGFDKLTTEWFRIDAKTLNPRLTTIYLYGERKVKNEDFTEFSTDELIKYNTLPDQTLDYYKEMHEKGERPLLFHFVQHILYKGSINFKNFEEIK